MPHVWGRRPGVRPGVGQRRGRARGRGAPPPASVLRPALSAALLQKYLDNYDLSIRVIYVLGTLGFSVGTAVMAMFANVYVAMVMISTMGIVSMSISYCPYALLGQYHDLKEVRLAAGRAGRGRGPASGRRDAHAIRCVRRVRQGDVPRPHPVLEARCVLGTCALRVRRAARRARQPQRSVDDGLRPNTDPPAEGAPRARVCPPLGRV